MDYKPLIEKYFAGETTLEEEQLLKAYFGREAEVADHLKVYLPLFRFFAAEKGRTLPAGFDASLEAHLQPRTVRRFRLNPLRLSIAAAIFVLALAVTLLVSREVKPVGEPPVASIDWSRYEPQTRQEAYEIARKALLKVSGGLNRGAKMAVERVEEEMEVFE